jgi:hypothetical protein
LEDSLGATLLSGGRDINNSRKVGIGKGFETSVSYRMGTRLGRKRATWKSRVESMKENAETII